MILRRFIISGVILVVVFTTVSFAAQRGVNVAVLPFEVHSEKEAEYLATTITGELSLQLATVGQIAPVDQEMVRRVLGKEPPFNFNEFTLRKFAEKLNAPFLVFGSMTKINNQLSLDVYVFDSRGDPPFSKEFSEGNELNSLIRGMARKVGSRIVLLASKYPEFRETEVVARSPEGEAEEGKPVGDTQVPSEAQLDEERGRLVTGYPLPEQREDVIVAEKVTEGGGEKEEELIIAGKELAALPTPQQEEMRTVSPAPEKKKTPETPFASDKPVQITSHSLVADNKSNKVTFKGDVVARQGDMVIFSDVMSVIYEGGAGRVRRIEASGNVKLTQGDRVATGKRIVFNNPEQTIVMTGNPRIWQGDNLISCEKVTVLLKEDKILFEGAVDSVIYPGGVKADSKDSSKKVEPLAPPFLGGRVREESIEEEISPPE